MKEEKKTDKEQHQRFRELAISQSQPLEVDETNGVIHDVLILGHKSRGMGVYSQRVMQEGAAKYEGVPTFIGHTRDGSNPDYDRKLGVHRNIHVTQDGLKSDFHFNPKHPCASQLMWDAKHDPHNVGFSHDADCRYNIQDGKRIVTSIDKVFSVDLVTRAGTTGGLFEEESQVIENDPALKQIAETGLAAIDNLRSIIFSRDMPIETKKQRMAEEMVLWRAELSKDPNALTDPTAGTLQEELIMGVEYKDLTVDMLTKERPDLVAVLTKQDDKSRLTEEVNTLKATVAAKDAELQTLAAEKAQRLKEQEINSELKIANFPITDEVIYSAKFKEQLNAATDKIARADLIRDRLAIAKGRMQEQVIPPSPFQEMRPETAATATADKSYDRLFGAK